MAEPVRADAPREGDEGPIAAGGSLAPGPAPGWKVRLFDSPQFLRLWLAQVVSSLGDWIGFVAITSVAGRIGGSSPEAAISLVLSARLLPGFFLAPVAGVFVDRWDRKKLMVVCDVGRGLVIATLPWVDTLPGLFLASLFLEVLTLLWSPAKEASVPNLVRPGYLATANSLSLVAAYGTFPVGALVFGLLAKVAESVLGLEQLDGLPRETVPLLFDAGTYVLSAVIISTLAFPARRPAARVSGGGFDLSRTMAELREGWVFIGSSRIVRSVIFGIAAGLVGGGMLVPLGQPFVSDVLNGGEAGFGLLLGALGTGVAGGIIGLSVVQRRLPHEAMFCAAVLGCGVSILAGASMSSLTPAVVLVALLGVCGGAVYVLGFTILQSNVDDDLRGRTFAAFYTLIRLCLLLAFAVAGFLSGFLNNLSERLVGGRVAVAGVGIAVPGVRLTLWLGGLIIVAAGVFAVVSLRPARRLAVERGAPGAGASDEEEPSTPPGPAG